jgi:hypothetical protein
MEHEQHYSDIPSTAIGAARLLPTTQTQIDVFSDQMIESVRSGEVYGLEVLHIFKSLEKAQERILKAIKDNILTEAEKYGKQPFDFQGVTMQIVEAGTQYDFSVCGDPVRDERDAAVNSAKSLLKERENFLKAIKEPTTIVIEGSGEVVTVRPPLKKSTTTVKVTIK